MTESEQLAEIKELIEKNNQQMEKRLDHLETKTEDISQKLQEFDTRFQEFDIRFREFDIRIDTYQKASQQVVNLAFSLIIAATAAIVIPAVFGR